MLEKASDELNSIERQQLLLIAIRRVTPAKRDLLMNKPLRLWFCGRNEIESEFCCL